MIDTTIFFVVGFMIVIVACAVGVTVYLIKLSERPEPKKVV
jgi:hypothetical protein